MQNRGKKNSETVNDHSNDSCDPKRSSFNESFDSSDEYEEPQINCQFRRWANNVWNLSNNVTNKLRELLGNNPTTNITTSNIAAEDGSRDGRNPINGNTSWTISSNLAESSKHINDGIHSRPRYHRHAASHHRNAPSRGNYCSYGQTFSHVAEGCRMSEIIPNKDETGSFGMAHRVATFSPVLVLPRLHHGVYQQPLHAGFHHSREQSLCCQNIHSREEHADGWYQRYHHSGIEEWGYEGPRGCENYSSLLERHEIPEKLSSLADESKSRGIEEEKFKRTDSVEQKIEPPSYYNDYEPVKHFFDHSRCSDFRNRKCGYKRTSPRRESRCLRREILGTSKISRNYRVNDACRNSRKSLAGSSRSKVKKVVWDMKLSDITSRELSSQNPSGTTLVAKSSEHSVSLNIEKKKRVPFPVEHEVFKSSAKTFVDRDTASNFTIPVKDVAEEPKVMISSTYDENTVKSSDISHLVQIPGSIDVRDVQSNGCQKQPDGMMTANSIKWSSLTENNFDSLLQSLRNRMETLANIHPTDIARSKNLSSLIETSINKGEVNLTKGCIVATCMTRNHSPTSFENRNNGMNGYSIKANEDIRPSFSDRIQDIWRDGRPRVRRGSPRHETTSSLKYNFKSEKDVSSKLSLLGLNRQPALREYFAEYNSAVTLARILDKLIDTKSRSDNNSSTVIPEPPKPKPRFTWKQSKTGLVDVGVQNSTPTSNMACQNLTTNSRHGLLKKHATRGSFMKTYKSQVPGVPVETRKPSQVFSGQSAIPISEIVQQPCEDVARFPKLPLHAKASSTCYDNQNIRHGHFIVVHNPIVRETNPTTVFDTRLRYSAQPHSLLHSKCRDFLPTTIASQRGSSSSSKRSSHTVEAQRTPPSDIFDSTKNFNALVKNRQFIDTREDMLSTVVRDQIEHERQYVQFPIPDNHINPQQTHDGSLTVRLRDRRVAKKSSDAVVDDISAKSRSWWSKKFNLSKSSVLKGKITSFLRNVIKKYPANDNHSKKDDFDTAVTKDVVLIPLIKKERKYLDVNRKLSKSIQRDLDSTELYSTKRIDSFQAPIINKVTVTTGTNTTAREYRKTSLKDSSKKLSKHNNVNPQRTAQIEISRNARTRSIDKGRIFDRTALKLNAVINVNEKLKLSESNDKSSHGNGSLLHREGFRSSSNPVEKEKKESSGLTNLKMSRSSSSKLNLATKLVNPFNATQNISTNRPNTAPILKNPLCSNALLEDIEAEKLSKKDSSSQENKTRVLFKHNRSSLLRANNSMLKKSAIRQFNLSRKIPGDKDIEIISILKSLTSSDTINEKESNRLFPVKENRSKKLVSEFKQFEKNKHDRNTEGLQSLPDVEMKDILEPPSISPNSEHKAKQSVAGETPYLDNGVSCPKMKDTTHTNKKIRNISALSSNSQSISPKHETSKRNRNLPEDGVGTSKNSECLKEKRRSPKSKTTPLYSEFGCSHAADEKKIPLMNLRSKKLSDEKRIKGNSINLKEKKAYRQSSSVLRCKKNQEEVEREEMLSKQLQEDHKLRLTEPIESKVSLNKVILSNSDLAEIESDNDQKSIPNAKSVFLERAEDYSTCKTEIAIDDETKLQPPLVYSTVSKTAEHFFKQVDVPVKKSIATISQKKETDFLDKPKRDYSLSKSNKNTIKSSKLLRKSFVPLNPTIAKWNPKKAEADASFSASSRATYNSQRPAVHVSGSEEPDSPLVIKTARAVSPAINRYKTGKKSKLGLFKGHKTRSKDAREMVGIIRRMLDAVINESMNMNQETNSDVVPSKENIDKSNTFDYEKSTVFTGEKLLIEETVSLSTADEMGGMEGNQSFLPPRQEKAFAKPCPRGSSNIYSKVAQSCPSSEFSSKIIAEVVGEGRKDFQEALSSEKFPVTSESLVQSEAEEICTPLQTKKDTKIRDVFRIDRSQDSKDGFCSLFDLTEILYKPEKLRLSMVNIHLENNVELPKLKGAVNVEESISTPTSTKLSSNTEWNLPRVTNDERRKSKCNIRERNVKIDNKVLEEKVKCSIENRVPLKTITITDPSVIKPNSTVMKKNISNIEFDEERSEFDIIFKEILIGSQASSLQASDITSEGQCSHRTWSRQKNRDIKTENFEYTKLNAEEEDGEIIDEDTRAADQNNLDSRTASIQLKKRATGQQGTLIPRYKNIPLDKSVRKKGSSELKPQ